MVQWVQPSHTTVLVPVLAAGPLPANVAEKVVDAGPSAWAPATHVGDHGRPWVPGFSWASPGHRSHVGSGRQTHTDPSPDSMEHEAKEDLFHDPDGAWL